MMESSIFLKSKLLQMANRTVGHLLTFCRKSKKKGKKLERKSGNNWKKFVRRFTRISESMKSSTNTFNVVKKNKKNNKK